MLHNPNSIRIDQFWLAFDMYGPMVPGRPELGHCWLWRRQTRQKGYGYTLFNGKRWRTHRLAYVLAYGQIPADKPSILHHCDNPPCGCPWHLWAGTNRENVEDRVLKGKARRDGVTASEAIAIRQRYAAGNITQLALSHEYGIRPSGIWMIVNRRSWRHLP